MYNKTILNNGLTIVTHRMPKRVSVTVGIWIKAGARYEAEQINGISHFLEHVLFKGTKKRSCEELKQAIEGVGGSLNGFTAQELTCYLAKVPAQYLASSLDILADMVLNAQLAGRDIETERKVILEEIRMYKDLPGHFVLDLLTNLLWPNQPLGRNIVGETEVIKAITRGQLFEFKQKFYRLNNIVIIVCGDLKHQMVVKECKKHFLVAAKTKPDKFVPAGGQQKSPQLNCQVKPTEQTHLALGLHGLARKDPDRFTLGLLHVILGGNMSSRLFREIREQRGLAYEINTAVKFFQDTGAFIVHAGIDNRQVAETLELILKQLRQIKQEPVEQQELNRAKQYYLGQLTLGLEDTADHMLWLGENFLPLNRFIYLQDVISKVNKIKPSDLQQVANRILQNRNLNLALIGPLKDKDKAQIKQRLKL